MLTFNSARAPGIRETLNPQHTEGPRLEPVVISSQKRSTPMFARILDCEVKLEKKDEFVKVVKNEVLPILRKQTGFLEILPFFPEKMKEEKVITISLWNTKADAERYEKEFYPKVLNILKPFLTTPVNVNYHILETTLCEHFVTALVA
jgi:heme-degrading monooxygenase HmoA